MSRVPGSRRVIYERPYAGLLTSCHCMDLSVARTFSLSGADLTLQGSVINAYDRRNIFYILTSLL